MGRAPDHAKADIDQFWEAPPEDVETQGCPGAWYRTDWYRSVAKYYRQRTDDGNRVVNLLLSQTDDPLVIEAIQALENFEEQARAEHLKRYYAEQAAKRKAKQQ